MIGGDPGTAPGGGMAETVPRVGPGGAARAAERGLDPGLPRALTGPGLALVLRPTLVQSPCRLDLDPVAICWGPAECAAFNLQQH